MHLSSVSDHGARCTVAAFHFPPVRPGVLLPHLYEVLGDEFIDCLVAWHSICTFRGTEGCKL